MNDITPGDGYVKFSLDWDQTAIDFPDKLFSEVNKWRTILHDRGLVGAYPDGIGYGNLSIRMPGASEFFITGSATGGIDTLHQGHYSLVKSYDIDGNSLVCAGEVKASSESMSHAALFNRLGSVNAVFHIHSRDLWNRYLHVLPTTDPAAEYGTPEMAHELARLATSRGGDDGVPSESEVSNGGGILIMGGHEDGIVSFGSDVDSAGGQLLELADRI